MYVPLFLLLAGEIFCSFTLIGALPGWWWGSRSKQKYWNRHGSEKYNVCSVGHCIQAWKCPVSAVSNQSSDHCAHWNNGPMVCCVLHENRIFTEVKSDVNSSEIFTSGELSKTTEKQNYWTSPKTMFNNGNSTSTKRMENHWTRKSWDKPITISSFGDVQKNSRDHNQNNTLRNIRTTVSWNKPRTSDVRVIFPTESVWIPKTSQTYTISTDKKTSDNKVTKSWMTRSTTPSAATFRYFTKSSTSGSVFTPKKLDHTSNSKSTKSWFTTATTAMTPRSYSTKHPKWSVSNPELTTKAWKRTTDYKSTKLGATRSTILAAVGYTPKTTRRTLLNPTNFPASGKSTNFAKTTTQVKLSSTKPGINRPQGWGKPTPTSFRGQSAKPKTIPVKRSSRSSTRVYRVTTPLPNVNTYLCGIRDERSTNRNRRHNEDRYAAGGNIYSSDKLLKSRQPYERIVGGEEVEPYSWPWVAALYKVASSGGNRFLCAGSLINENFILTAAHVFTPDDLRTASYFVMLGTHNAQDSVAQYLVSSILRHPLYENRYYYHDIALLKLERPVVFNDYVMPVCLPSPNAPLLRDSDLEGKNVTVMGWGDESFGGKSSRVLKQASFPVVSRMSCNASYVRVASNRFPKGITDGMLCAGDPNGGKDACQGDSGGPLTSIQNRRYTQVGIVSFGYQCGDKEYPGVYTKVAPYLSWIAENTVRNQDYGNGDYDYY